MCVVPISWAVQPVVKRGKKGKYGPVFPAGANFSLAGKDTCLKSVAKTLDRLLFCEVGK